MGNLSLISACWLALSIWVSVEASESKVQDFKGLQAFDNLRIVTQEVASVINDICTIWGTKQDDNIIQYNPDNKKVEMCDINAVPENIKKPKEDLKFWPCVDLWYWRVLCDLVGNKTSPHNRCIDYDISQWDLSMHVGTCHTIYKTSDFLSNSQ